MHLRYRCRSERYLPLSIQSRSRSCHLARYGRLRRWRRATRRSIVLRRQQGRQLSRRRRRARQSLRVRARSARRAAARWPARSRAERRRHWARAHDRQPAHRPRPADARRRRRVLPPVRDHERRLALRHGPARDPHLAALALQLPRVARAARDARVLSLPLGPRPNRGRRGAAADAARRAARGRDPGVPAER